ncbi:MAG: glycosyltransferase [Solirubrobacterales bacterium]
MLLHKSVEFDSRVRREASALAAAGHEVTVLELASVTVGAGTMDGFARRSVQPPTWLRRRLPFHLYRAAFLWWFVAGIARTRPDVVHAHDAAMLLPGVLGARLTGAQLVYDSHELATSVPYRERAWAAFVAGIERLTVPRCAAVITVSDGIAERLRARYRLARTPTVVRNVSALSPNGRGGLRERLEIDAGAPLVLHQGAPAPARGCEVLVEALAALPGVRLAFLGDPEPGYAAGLRRLIAERGLGERVTLLPSVALEDLLAHTAEANVGVTLLQDTCLNHRLALPNKLFEYIAAGVPVVAADLPETRRLVAGYGVGWCVAPADSAALAGALRVALHGPRDPRLHERLARAAEELSWKREQVRLLELYERLARLPSTAGPCHWPASRSEADEHEAVGAQRRNARERPIQAPSAPGQRRREGERTHGLELPQPATQLSQAHQAGVAVGGGDARLPDRHDAARSQHAAHLAERRSHVLARGQGR